MLTRRQVREVQLAPKRHIGDFPPVSGGTKKIVLLVPGIRTNAEWIDQANRDLGNFGSQVNIIKTYGGRIPAFSLITRLGLSKIRHSIYSQITQSIIDYPDHQISLICHSLGTDLIAEIFRKNRFRFDHVFFLASVCHDRHLVSLRQSCSYLTSHKGTYDIWPIMASIARPDTYMPSGVFGFNQGVHVNEMTFENDHFSCTDRDHILTYVIPTILGSNATYPSSCAIPLSQSGFVYMRRAIYILTIAFPVLCYFKYIYSFIDCIVILLLFISLFCLMRRRRIPSTGSAS